MGNAVCRAITLYSYQIPIRLGSMLVQSQYSTMGFFDEMSTELLDVNYITDDLSNLWNYIMEQNKKCDGSYSFQNIFLMADDDWNEGCTDRELWCEETDREYPLTMVVFLQLKEYMSGTDSIHQQCTAFTRKAKEYLKEGKVYTYCSVDKNDFLVCIKCKNYHNSVETIKELHATGKKIVYSYSVFSINHAVLESLSQDHYEYIFNETIESICLKGITNSISGYGDRWDDKYYTFCEKLAESLYVEGEREERVVNNEGEIEIKTKDRIYDILGDNDFRYIAREVNLGKLLSEFKKDGILSYQNKEFASYLFSSSLVLNTQTPFRNLLNDRNEEFPVDLKCCEEAECILNEIDRIIRNKNIDNDQVLSVYYALHQLLQSFKVLEMSPAKRYDFFSMFHSFRMLLDIVKEKLEGGMPECFCENNDIFDFIHKISMVFHSAQRTDIQFFQIQDFNVIVHYSPAKLRAFYALWILKLSELYKALKTRKNRNYSFIVSPGMFDVTLVKQLFPNAEEKNRLMLVTLPDNSIYKIKWLPIILSHEAAHIGCERKRINRHYAALEVCTRVILLEIHAFMFYGICMEREVVKQDTIVQAIHHNRNLLKDLQDILRERTEEIFADMDEDKRDRECRRDKSKQHICEAFDYMYNYYHEKVIAVYCCALKNMFVENRMRKNKDKSIARSFNELQDDLQYFMRIFIEEQLSDLIDAFYYIEEEAYADLITTLTLEYSMEDYLKFCAYVEKTEKENKILPQGEAVIIRMASVINTMCSIVKREWIIEHKRDFANKWQHNQLWRLCKKFPKDSKEKKLAAKIFFYSRRVRDMTGKINKYQRRYDPENAGFVGNTYDFLNDWVIWTALCRYLYECAKEYIEKMAGDHTIQEMQQECAKTYARLGQNSYTDVIQVIEDYLCKNANENVLNGIRD